MSSYDMSERPSQWQSCNNWFHRQFEKCFGFIGYHIAKHPWVTIIVSLTIAAGLSCGFIRIDIENRTEKLYIPQDSKSIQDLDKAEKFFPSITSREMSIVLENKNGGNVLTNTCLSDVLTIHNAIASLPKYATYCVLRRNARRLENTTRHCVLTNPLEIFRFDSKLLVNISTTLGAAYNTTLMQNGRPAYLNFPRMFANMKWDNGNLQSADAIQIDYHLLRLKDDNGREQIMEVEKAFIDKMQSLQGHLSCMKMYFAAARSLDDAITESTGQDIVLISITFTLMISFACTMLGKFLNPLTGHSQLANAGILSVGLGITSGFGLAIAAGVPFVSLVGVLPFLIVGIGIDDMFIIVDELDRQDNKLSVVDTIKCVMSHSGPTVTMTTVTDLVAFAVSTSTAFPSVRYFCVYAALAITFSYLMMITFFVAMTTFDVKRIKANRRDCCPSCFAPKPKDGKAGWDEPRANVSNKVMRIYARFLMKTPVRVTVVILSLALLGVSIWGAMNISESFDRRVLAKDDSYFKDFITVQEKHFQVSPPVSIVVDTKLDYGSNVIQDDIIKLSDIVAANKHYRPNTINWMFALKQNASASGMNMTGTQNFMRTLKVFLRTPQFSHFGEDIVLSSDNSSVSACRVVSFMKDSPSSIFQRDAMQTLRDDLEKKDASLASYPISKFFIYFEQYVLVQIETIRNLAVAGAAVLVITWPFLLSIKATLLVFWGFSALIVELFALMTVWDVSLNSVSMINLVMAIGFSVDYSAHIAHAFVTSSEPTAELRAEDALSTLGASVVMGGISTFLGMVVTAFAASEIFRIFFKMFLGIVLLGLLHGLCILPVYMSIICRWKISKKVHSENKQSPNGHANHGLDKTQENGHSPPQQDANNISQENPINIDVKPIFHQNGSQDTAHRVTEF